MRDSITKGRQVKAHVKVMVRLKNGNRLRGVVKDGRLVERVDGLRFVDAQARDLGAGIRLWYSGGTRSYIFVPFQSLKNYEVVQRLSQKQLMDIETEMQMADKGAKERVAKAARQAKGNASAAAAAPAPGTLEVNSAAPRLSDLQKVPGFGNLPKAVKPLVGRAPVGIKAAGKLAAAKAAVKGAKKSAVAPAKVSDPGSELKEAKKELVWAQLLRSYPPKSGWNEAKKNEIARRKVVIGVVPSDFEMDFVKKFDDWVQACEHNGVDPNAGVIQKPKTKRQRRIEERRRVRGR
ncbi:MAG: hypothetical protein ACI89X_001395 [Planctomycetota bacterium]|jgi:hypothetical protein